MVFKFDVGEGKVVDLEIGNSLIDYTPGTLDSQKMSLRYTMDCNWLDYIESDVLVKLKNLEESTASDEVKAQCRRFIQEIAEKARVYRAEHSRVVEDTQKEINSYDYAVRISVEGNVGLRLEAEAIVKTLIDKHLDPAEQAQHRRFWNFCRDQGAFVHTLCHLLQEQDRNHAFVVKCRDHKNSFLKVFYEVCKERLEQKLNTSDHGVCMPIFNLESEVDDFLENPQAYLQVLRDQALAAVSAPEEVSAPEIVVPAPEEETVVQPGEEAPTQLNEALFDPPEDEVLAPQEEEKVIIPIREEASNWFIRAIVELWQRIKARFLSSSNDVEDSDDFSDDFSDFDGVEDEAVVVAKTGSTAKSSLPALFADPKSDSLGSASVLQEGMGAPDGLPTGSEELKDIRGTVPV
jgi:predicted nucleotidyltransferase